MAVVVARVIARVEKKLIGIAEARCRRDSRIRRAHAERIHPAVLRDGVGCCDHDAYRDQEARPHYFVARFVQKRSRLSSPPKSVVKIVESARRMSPARFP